MQDNHSAAVGGQLHDWRVIYYTQSNEDGLMFCCQAEDAAHALEQFANAEPDAVAISIVREDTSRILPAVEGDFEMPNKGSAWISVHNASVLVSDHSDHLVVTVFPRGCEDGQGHEQVFRYTHLAHDAIFGQGDSPSEIREQTASLYDHHLKAHLAEMDTGSSARIKSALKLYAVLVPVDDLGVDPGSAVVTPLPMLLSDRITIHFESNRFGAENMHRFIEKVYHAADRADARYPTIAMRVVTAGEVKRVGTYSHALKRIIEISDPAALRAWAGEIGSHTL